MITPATIDKIFSTIRVEEIIGEFVQLKRAGANLKGLSPFRDEKTPSFVVSPSKQIWKDFSTGKGGNAISFLMELEGFTYPEALRYAAKKYSIEIEEDKRELTEEEKKSQSNKDLLYKIHEVANDFFQNSLWETQEGKQIGLSYYKERQLSEVVIKKFQLGYSPELKNAFTQYALEKGYSKEILENSGLSIFPENTPSGIDRFRERIIFPIQSFSGRIIGFGARILKSNIKTAKYLNSPETEIYHKSNVLYGLNQSKQSVAKENLCLLVEGYMDVVSLHQAGIENVVASSGTALTVEQIKLIKRLTENVTILFDGDTAGIKASFRSIDLLLQQGMNIRVLLFPDGHDPDSFAKAHPRDFVDDFIKKEAKDFIDFKAEVLLKEADNDPIKKAEAIRDIVRSIAFVSNSLKQEVYLQEVSNKFSLSQQSLFNELGVQNQIVLQNVPKNKLEIAPKLEIVDDQLPTINPMLLLEEKLVELMLKYGDRIIKGIDAENNEYEISVIEIIINHLLEDNYELQTPLNKKIVHEIEIGIQENSLRSGEFFATLMDEEISTKVADALIEPYQTSNWEQFNIVFKTEEQLLSKIINDVIMRHKREYILKLIDDMKSSLQSLENKDEVYTKIISLNQLKRKIDEQLYRVL